MEGQSEVKQPLSVWVAGIAGGSLICYGVIQSPYTFTFRLDMLAEI